MRVGIVGSRNFGDEEAVRRFVRSLACVLGATRPGDLIHELHAELHRVAIGADLASQDEVIVVSGGADGVDQWAAAEARALGLPVEEILPEWERYGKAAGVIRNNAIVARVDHVVAFWDGVSAGTQSTIRAARRAGKLREVYELPAHACLF